MALANFNGYITWRGRQVSVDKKSGPGYYMLTIALAAPRPLTDKEWASLKDTVHHFTGEK